MSPKHSKQAQVKLPFFRWFCTETHVKIHGCYFTESCGKVYLAKLKMVATFGKLWYQTPLCTDEGIQSAHALGCRYLLPVIIQQYSEDMLFHSTLFSLKTWKHWRGAESPSPRQAEDLLQHQPSSLPRKGLGLQLRLRLDFNVIREYCMGGSVADDMSQLHLLKHQGCKQWL